MPCSNCSKYKRNTLNVEQDISSRKMPHLQIFVATQPYKIMSLNIAVFDCIDWSRYMNRFLSNLALQNNKFCVLFLVNYGIYRISEIEM